MMNEEELRENTLETTEVKVFAVGDALVSGDTRRAIELVRASLLTMDAGEFLRGSSVGSVRKK
jgi:Cdc6-like AAA superfamily ATPase